MSYVEIEVDGPTNQEVREYWEMRTGAFGYREKLWVEYENMFNELGLTEPPDKKRVRSLKKRARSQGISKVDVPELRLHYVGLLLNRKPLDGMDEGMRDFMRPHIEGFYANAEDPKKYTLDDAYNFLYRQMQQNAPAQFVIDFIKKEYGYKSNALVGDSSLDGRVLIKQHIQWLTRRLKKEGFTVSYKSPSGSVYLENKNEPPDFEEWGVAAAYPSIRLSDHEIGSAEHKGRMEGSQTGSARGAIVLSVRDVLALYSADDWVRLANEIAMGERCLDELTNAVSRNNLYKFNQDMGLLEPV